MFCLPLFAQQDDSQVPESVKRSRPYRRVEWFLQQRAYPLGYIPAGVRQKALSQVDQMIANETRSKVRSFALRGLALANPPASAASGSAWSPMGPQPTSTVFSNNPVSGRLVSIVVDPVTPSTIYVGAAMGGVWRSTDSGANWTPLTDDQPTLAVGAVALDPDNHLNVWVATGEENFGLDNYYGAGILKSTDGGSTWTQLAQSTFGTPINAIPPTVGGAKIGSLAILKGSGGQIAIAAVQFFQQSGFTPASGIYRTADGGATWNNVHYLNLTSDNVAAGNVVAWDPNNSSSCASACRGYATIGSSFGDSTNGFYVTTDSGQNWTQITGTLPSFPSSNVGRIAMDLAKNNSGNAVKTTIYLGIGNSSTQNTLSMWKSTDGGASWSQLLNAPNYCPGQCFYDNVIGVVPNNDSVVFAGGSFSNDGGSTASIFWRSSDGGATWQEFSKASGASFSSLHADLHAIAFSPDNATVYAGTDGGIWSSSNATNVNTANTGVTWTNLNGSSTDATKSLATTQFYPGMSTTASNFVFGGTQDNGSQIFSGNLAWSMVACGDGGWSVIDPNNQNNLYTACNSGPIDIEKSTSASPSWFTFTQSTTGINTSDRANFIPPLVMDPANSSTLYFGSFKLYQSTNAATNWTAMASGADLTGGGNAHINAIGVGPNNVVWVGTSGSGSSVTSKVQVSTNANLGASATFTDRSSGLPTRAVTQVMPDPADATGGTAYVTFSGFDQYSGGTGGDGLGYVYKTINFGANWTNLTGNLPHSPVNDIVIDPSIANTLYVGTDVGVFYTSNANAAPPTWNTLVSGLPKSAVLSLKLHNGSRTLVAGTHGRSVWRVVVGGVAGVAPASLTFGAQGFSLASAPKSVTITNTGSASVTLSSLTINSSEFALVVPIPRRPIPVPTCANATVLGGGASCAAYVAFTPTAAGARNATLSIVNDGAVSPLTVSLSGTGPTASAVSLLPNPVGFGNVVLNGDSTIAVALSNATAAAVSLSSFTVPAGYSQTSNCPASLNAGAGCIISVTFQPTSLTTFSGNLAVTAAGNPVNAAVSGAGTGGAVALARPNTTLGGAFTAPTTLSPSRPARGVHSGANLVVAGGMVTVPIVFAPGDAAGTASLSCVGAPDGSTCNVEPSALTLRGGSSARANVKIASNDRSAAPHEYEVQVVAKTDSFSSVLAIPIRVIARQSDVAHSRASGNAAPAAASSDTPGPAAFEIAPARLEFHADDRKRDAAARGITITNKQATPLSVSVDSLDGDFVQTNDCGLELQPASTCRISVRPKPDVSFPTAGRLRITTSAGAATVELQMRYEVKPEERD